MFSVAIFVCLGWIGSVCLHEFGHAIVAYWGGDTSVKDKGYLTLNPLKYTEINLSLILPLIFLLMGGIALPGAAVYIDRSKLRNRLWQSAVSAAGPVASIVVAFLLARLFQISLAWRNTEYWWFVPALACLIFLQIYVTIINSLPIPSLDGYGVIEPWLPRKIQRQFAKYNNYGFVFLFILLWFVKPVNLFLGDTATAIAQWLGVPDIAIAAGFALFQKSSGILLITAIGIIFIIRRFMQKPHEYWYNQAQAFSKSGRYEKAIEAYDRVIQTKPNQYEIWYKQGHLLFLLKRYEEAIASYDRAIQVKPDFEEAWCQRGLALFNLNRFKEAVASYDEAIQIKPDFDEAWYNRGLALSYSKQYEEAIASYDRAIQIKFDNILAWFFRSLALSQLQRSDEALAGYEQVIKMKPDFASAWTHRGCVLNKLTRHEDAIVSFDRAIKIKPEDPASWSDKGEALCKLQRYEQAIASYDRAIQLNPKYTLAWYNKACCYAEQNSIEQAIESLKQAIALDAEQVKEYAKTDSSFDSIRKSKLFQQLMDE